MVAAVAAGVAALLVFHRAVPDTGAHLGSLLETFLPWLGLTIPPLAVLAWWRRPAVALPAVLVALAAWLAVFGGNLLPGRETGHDLVAVQHNVDDGNPDPAGTVRELLRADPDLIALEEVTRPDYAQALTAYPHHATHGTVGLWSRYPLVEAAPLDIRPGAFGPDWNRGLRAVARTPHGDVAVYVAHLPSVRLGAGGFDCAARDESARKLGAALAREPLAQVLLLGDLNGTVQDRGLAPVTRHVRTARDWALSWPQGTPVARIDQIMGRRLTVTALWSLPATGSDHLPLGARVRLRP